MSFFLVQCRKKQNDSLVLDRMDTDCSEKADSPSSGRVKRGRCCLCSCVFVLGTWVLGTSVGFENLLSSALCSCNFLPVCFFFFKILIESYFVTPSRIDV